MTTRRARPQVTGALLASLACTTPTQAEDRAAAIPGGCSDPPTQRSSEVGCSLHAVQPIEKLPDEPVFWHLYSYATRTEAEAARSDSSTGTVAQAFGKNWLFTIADARWRPAAGERVAVIGPLPIGSAEQYIARYMEATFQPSQQLQTSVHRHSGPEAWYVLTGAQCLRTPESTLVLRAGEGGFVPPGPPMVLTAIGTEMRRALLVVLHDASQPWQTNITEWTPSSECPPY